MSPPKLFITVLDQELFNLHSRVVRDAGLWCALSVSATRVAAADVRASWWLFRRLPDTRYHDTPSVLSILSFSPYIKVPRTQGKNGQNRPEVWHTVFIFQFEIRYITVVRVYLKMRARYSRVESSPPHTVTYSSPCVRMSACQDDLLWRCFGHPYPVH